MMSKPKRYQNLKLASNTKWRLDKLAILHSTARSADKTEWQYFDERKQFDTFRKNLTVLAGFREVSYTIDGRMRVDAQSLSYGNMEQDEFERCYSALINAAMQNIFKGCNDERILDRLYAFFY